MGNSNKNIKHKLDQHEFDFNPKSWDNMEVLLNGSTSKKSYFKTKTILIMTTLFFLLAYLLLQQQATPPLANFNTPQATVQDFPPDSCRDQNLEGINLENQGTADLTDFQNWSNPTNDSSPNDQQSTTSDQSSPFTIHHSPLKENPFFEQLTEKLTAYNAHYAPEKTYLQFDRTFFEPGEDIWFNAFLRNANSLKISAKGEILYVELLAPNGSVSKKITLRTRNGRAAGDFQLDAAATGGMYKIRAYTNWQKNTGDAFERDIQVQASVLPRLRMEMDFQREAYGPGDKVEAKISLNTLANQPLSNYSFNVKASLDGEQFQEIKGKTDISGRAVIKIDLSKKLTTNDGLLNALIEYNGQTESISRSIPIVLNKIDLQFMPEGGDPVAGIQSAVAFKALNEFGKPADVEGVVTDAKGNKITTFRSYHQGMGAFDMMPENGETYIAYLTKPEGISETYELPKAQPRGYAIRVNNSNNNELAVEINSTENEPLHVVLVSSGEIYFTQTLPPQAGAHLIKIPTATLPIGTTQVTLFDSKETPRAERLVFLNPLKKLNVEITTNKEKYLPREKVEMTVKVTDERGMPMPGQFALSVADDNLLTFADDKQGHILSYLLLESELAGEVLEPNFYFGKKEKQPEKDQLLALDYLMLTQGWRRFNWEEVLWEQPMAFERERYVTNGIVMDKNGNPVPRMLINLKDSELMAMSDENGRFEFDTIFPVGQQLEVKHHSWEGRQFFADGTNGQLQIRLPFVVEQYADLEQSPISLEKIQLQVETSLQGTLKDGDSGEPLIFATVAVYKNGVLVTGTETDFDGFYSITELDPGLYDVVFSYTGYQDQRVAGVTAASGRSNVLDADMSAGVMLNEVVVTSMGILKEKKSVGYAVSTISVDDAKKAKPNKGNKDKKNDKSGIVLPQVELVYEKPLTVSDATTQGKTISSEDIKNLPTRNVNALASLGAGATSAEDGSQINIRSSRADGTNYYIDGVRVSGSTIPSQYIEELQTIKGGTPAALSDLNRDLNDEQLWAEQDRVRRMNNLKDAMQAKKNDASTQINVAGETVEEINNDNNYRNHAVLGFEKKSLINFHAPRQFYSPKYAPINHQSSIITERNDFRKTVFWKPDLTTDRNGIATVEFYNSDAITTFQATVEGLGMDGSIGHGEQHFFTQMPFGMDVKIPTNLLTGDRLVLPLTLMNNSRKPISGKLNINTPPHFSLAKPLAETIELKAGETKTVYPEYNIGFEAKTGDLQVAFLSEGLQDAFSETIKVQPRGFPVHQVFGGNQPSQTFEFEVNDPVEGSLEAAFTVHPSVLSELTSGFEKMLRQPGGCFEQTSSSNYPNVLVLNFLQKTGNAAPDLVQRANGHLDFGYKRLKTFEVKDGGFDWYGKPPAHEALTAYGLMEFVDMKTVYPVEQELIDRTAQWLLTRRDGQGGWDNGQKGLHSWKQKSPVADAYITWAMTEAGYGAEVSKEVEKTLKDANTLQDPYIMALAANCLINIQDGRAAQLLGQLAELQNTDGNWTGLTHSMTHSTGKNLTVETTGLATLAFLKASDLQIAEDGQWSPAKTINNAVDYLATTKTQYGFGSTQATILALKALVKHAENTLANMQTGPVAVFVNGEKAGEQPISTDQNEPIVFTGLAEHFINGKNQVEVKFVGSEKALPYDLSISYNTRQPRGDANCLLDLKTELIRQTVGGGRRTEAPVQMGETVRLSTTLTNKSAEGVPNPIAIIGIPAGLGIQPWQVKEMQEKNECDFYEIKNGYVVFYFREMDGHEIKNIHLDLKAEIPGEFEAPASSAYLYYANDVVAWDKPGKVEIACLPSRPGH